MFIDKFNLNLPDASPFLQAMIRFVTKIFKDLANNIIFNLLSDLSEIMNKNMFKLEPLNLMYDDFATDRR